MMKLLVSTILLCVLFLMSGLLIRCGNDDGSDKPKLPELFAPTNIIATDVGNFGNGRDLKITFSKPSELSAVKEFRLFIVAKDQGDSFDSLQAIANTNYLSILPSEQTSNVRFLETQMDSQGDLISENIPYLCFIMSMAKEGSEIEGGKLSTPSKVFTLMQKNVVRTLTTNIQGGTGGMDVDEAGNIYMADFGASLGGTPGTRVYKITPDGSVNTFATGLNGASGNDFDSNGNLLQSNIRGGSITKIEPDGSISVIANGLSSPVGIAVAPNGDFFVCNCGSNSIAKVTSTGEVSIFSSSSLMQCPNGIDIDDQGNLYVANFDNNILVKISPEGAASNFATLPSINNGHLLINRNHIYVISRGIHQIHRVTFTGSVSLFAGNGQRGIVDGPLEEASFSLPNDLAFSPDGTMIYINDVSSSNQDPSIISPSIIRVIELVE